MRYIKIDKEDVCNGNGLRVVLWLSGCPHHCKGCQNTQTWDEDSGIKFNNNTKAELFNELKKDYISGITLSGGDPLYSKNLENVLNLTNEIRLSFPDKNIWLYSGYTWEEVFSNDVSIRKDIVSNCDVFIDGRYVEELRDITLKWCGSSNQRVINVQESLRLGEVVLWK
jgi:anaerobic ribonucleoside-triphosphate reductase activating protein